MIRTYGGELAGTPGAATIALVLEIVVGLCGLAVLIYVFYSVTWRAIRRGLREYNRPPKNARPRP
ncbi:MAG TPA: hypothetical protein VHZ81_05665 [Galbitalea sp.]|jgi:hypothetical protein|nr:hypothetical protein [Galbitalea sp.]